MNASNKILQGILILFLLVSSSFEIVKIEGSQDTGTRENFPVKDHPRIFVSNEPKKDFLKRVQEVAWKKQMIEEKQEDLKKYMALCKKDPDWLLSRLQMNWKTKHTNVYLMGGKFSHSDGDAPVPTVRYSGTRDWATDYSSPDLEDVKPYLDDPRGLYLQRKDNKQWEWVKPPATGHIIEGINRKVMRLVEDAAFMFWMTRDKKYAEFATPIFFQYMEGMYYRNAPEVLNDSSQKGLSGLATFEVIHESIVISLALTYDFLFDYFKKQGKDLGHSQAVFQKWGDQIIKNGVPNNNWNLFQARFLTYIAMVLENDAAYENGKGQQYYLRNTFDISSERQIAIKESLLVYDQENGIWPESASYSMHVTTTLLEILTLLDHLTNKNEVANFPIVEKAALAAFQYLFPSGYTVGFGDSGHKIVPPKNFELLIANYRKYGLKEKEHLITGLLNDLIQNDLYERDGRGLFEMFFYVDQLSIEKSESQGNELITPTFYAPNVSMFVQRLGAGKDATMFSTVGSYGNHAHANGISMELFANGYVLGPDMGRGASYWNPDHREYYSQFPAHNTVVVDGISTYRAMRSYHPYALDNCFPKSEEITLFDKVTYSKVSFLEPKTMSNQQRLTAQVQSKAGPGYIVDIFRSKKAKDTTQMHDYFYHNLGQSLQVFEGGKEVSLSDTQELSSANGLLKAYDYFTDNKTVTLDDDLTAMFTLKEQGKPDNLMKMWIKGAQGQQIFTVKGPRSKALSKGTAPEEMVDAQVPAIMLRRKQAAWKRPFVSVFNPTWSDQENAIADVTFNEDGYGAQIIEVAMGDGSKDIITAGQSESSIIVQEGLEQKGLFSVVRLAENGQVEFIMVSGMNVFRYKGWDIISEGAATSVTIERDGNAMVIENDQPIMLRVKRSDNYSPKMMTLYEQGKEVGKRAGKVSRFDKDLIEFRIAKLYDKVVIN
ncbi:MAG: heparinase II/III family protein [Cyclobacteriaceae bacterium]